MHDCVLVMDIQQVQLCVLVQVVKEFGCSDDDTEKWLVLLRLASSFYPDDSDFMTIPLYKRFNRSRDGTLNVGDTIPQISVTDLDGEV
jgi:hypothetical protein